jgi:hypothetical protein
MRSFASLIACCILLTAVSASAKAVPDMTLPDPRGGRHNLKALAGAGGLVLVISDPTLEDRSAQEAWSKFLADTRGANRGTFVMVEDMGEAFFKSIALHEMKEDWRPGDVPLLLVDNENTLNVALGVHSEETVVFAYGKTGTLVQRYAGTPSESQARAIWKSIQQ